MADEDIVTVCAERSLPFNTRNACRKFIFSLLSKSCVSQTLHSLTGRLQPRGRLFKDTGNKKGCAGTSIQL